MDMTHAHNVALQALPNPLNCHEVTDIQSVAALAKVASGQPSKIFEPFKLLQRPALESHQPPLDTSYILNVDPYSDGGPTHTTYKEHPRRIPSSEECIIKEKGRTEHTTTGFREIRNRLLMVVILFCPLSWS